jgi:hypothetical protein
MGPGSTLYTFLQVAQRAITINADRIVRFRGQSDSVATVTPPRCSLEAAPKASRRLGATPVTGRTHLDRYVGDAERRRLGYRVSLGAVPERTFVNHPLAMVTRAEALAWAEHLGETHAPPGRASFVRSARAFYSWLVSEEEVIDCSPFARMKISAPESVKRTPDVGTINVVISKARTKRDRCILVMLADTAARKGEIAGLLL